MSFVRLVRLRIEAGNARPGPAIGQSLGPLGINMSDFCKQFNDRTKDVYEKELPLRVLLTALSDRSFTFQIRSPPVSYLIKRNLGTVGQKGASDPNAELDPCGQISPEAIYEIAKIKQQDDHMWHLPVKGIARSVAGTARSMGIVVKDHEEKVSDSDEEEE